MTTDATPPMEERGALLSQAIDAMRALAANVSGDGWDAQSPCTEWKARDVVNHVVGGSSMITSLFAGKSWEEASGGSESIPEGADPLAAFDAATGAAKEAVSKPGAMEQEVQFARGPMPGAGFASMMFTDVLIHAGTWPRPPGRMRRCPLSWWRRRTRWCCRGRGKCRRRPSGPRWRCRRTRTRRPSCWRCWGATQAGPFKGFCLPVVPKGARFPNRRCVGPCHERFRCFVAARVCGGLFWHSICSCRGTY